jgi:peptide/nickel transport system substrate-binding protein
LKTQLIYINVIFLSLILIFACTKNEKTAVLSRHGGVVNIALNSAIEDLFPLTSDEYNVEQIHRYMLTPSLVKFDDDGNALPYLADIWKIDEQNLSIIFILNPEFRWSNGNSVRADDVKFSVNMIKTLPEISGYSSIISNIKKLEIIDSLSCEISLNQAVAEPLYFTNFPIFPAVNEYEISDINKFKESYFKSFIGCGPFIISNYNSDSLVLRRNNYYPNKFPYLDQMIFNYVGDSDQLKQLINLKKIDFAVNLPLALTADKSILQKFNILSYPEKGYTFIGWNLKSDLLNTKTMRLALSHSIDRQTLIDGIMAGYSEIVDGPVYYKQKRQNSFLPELDFNAAKADCLFNSLGWKNFNEQGIRIKDGNKLSINMLVNRENKERIDIAKNIKANLKSLGVDLQLKYVTWKEVLKAIKLKSSDAILLNWTDGVYYDPSLLFHSDAIQNGLNFMSYKSDIADSLMNSALYSWDKKQKDYYWKEFQKKVSNDLPCTFLFSQKIIVAYDKKIQNVLLDSRGFLVNAKEWWLE